MPDTSFESFQKSLMINIASEASNDGFEKKSKWDILWDFQTLCALLGKRETLCSILALFSLPASNDRQYYERPLLPK